MYHTQAHIVSKSDPSTFSAYFLLAEIPSGVSGACSSALLLKQCSFHSVRSRRAACQLSSPLLPTSIPLTDAVRKHIALQPVQKRMVLIFTKPERYVCEYNEDRYLPRSACTRQHHKLWDRQSKLRIGTQIPCRKQRSVRESIASVMQSM